MTPEYFIKTIRESFIGSEYIYTHGSCYHFYKIIKTVFSEASPWYIDGHVITKINGKFYDINGEVSGDDAVQYAGQLGIDKQPFSLWYLGVECPACDEIFCFGELLKDKNVQTK